MTPTEFAQLLHVLQSIDQTLDRIANEGITLNKPAQEPFDSSASNAHERIDPSLPPSKPKHWSSQEEREEMQRECDKFKCPLCNGVMRARQARATQEWFMGCAAYPECTGTRHMDGQNSTRRKAPAKQSEPEPDDCPSDEDVPF